MKTLHIDPGSPLENGYVESFNGKRWDERLSWESFETLLEARVLIERWREHSKTVPAPLGAGVSPTGPRDDRRRPARSGGCAIPQTLRDCG